MPGLLLLLLPLNITRAGKRMTATSSPSKSLPLSRAERPSVVAVMQHSGQVMQNTI